MSPRFRILSGLASLMFVMGLVYGALSGNLAMSATADDSSSFSSNEGSAQDSNGARDGGSCLTDPAVLEEIRAQRESLAKSQKELAAKEQELKDREKAMAEELKKVQAIRDEINKTDELRKKENEEKVAKVIETLGTMSPKASAKMLAELDDALAVEVLVKMDTAKLAKIMNLLEPKRASALTEMLAGVTRARAAGNAQHMSMASADTVTGRDGVRTNPNQKGGENYDGQNQDNSNNSNSRKPSSIQPQGGSSNIKAGALKGSR
jgi:flagellar motility protein MotE (MotC chaperone)